MSRRLKALPTLRSHVLFLVAYDPATDFTIGPWLPDEASAESALGQSLGQSLGGASISAPANEPLDFFGYPLDLAATLLPTGTTLDRSLLVTFATARDMLRTAPIEAAQGFTIPADSVSSVLVKVAPGADPKQVAADIRTNVPGASPISSPDLFSSLRDQMQGQQAGMLVILAVILALSLSVTVLIFSMVASEQRREIGVLRALGATRRRVLGSLLGSAAVLALIGGVAGIVLSGLVLRFFRQALADAFGFPFLFPSLSSLILLLAIGIAVALGGALLAAFIPAYRVSRQDPAVSMRE